MHGLTDQQERLLKRGKALIAHCPECELNVFIGELPMDASKVARLSNRAKCPVNRNHKLMMGPVK